MKHISFDGGMHDGPAHPCASCDAMEDDGFVPAKETVATEHDPVNPPRDSLKYPGGLEQKVWSIGWIEVVRVQGLGACWEWNGARLARGGYGQIRWGPKNYRVPRLAYELWVGPIEDGLHVLHRCDNPSCLNPEHLVTGTNQENAKDRVSKGRSHSKLTLKQVAKIKALLEEGYDNVTLARRFGVTRQQIWNIKKGKLWKTTP